jgi:hypothetical protein
MSTVSNQFNREQKPSPKKRNNTQTTATPQNVSAGSTSKSQVLQSPQRNELSGIPQSDLARIRNYIGDLASPESIRALYHLIEYRRKNPEVASGGEIQELENKAYQTALKSGISRQSLGNQQRFSFFANWASNPYAQSIEAIILRFSGDKRIDMSKDSHMWQSVSLAQDFRNYAAGRLQGLSDSSAQGYISELKGEKTKATEAEKNFIKSFFKSIPSVLPQQPISPVVNVITPRIPKTSSPRHFKEAEYILKLILNDNGGKSGFGFNWGGGTKPGLPNGVHFITDFNLNVIDINHTQALLKLLEETKTTEKLPDKSKIESLLRTLLGNADSKDVAKISEFLQIYGHPQFERIEKFLKLNTKQRVQGEIPKEFFQIVIYFLNHNRAEEIKTLYRLGGPPINLDELFKFANTFGHPQALRAESFIENLTKNSNVKDSYIASLLRLVDKRKKNQSISQSEVEAFIKETTGKMNLEPKDYLILINFIILSGNQNSDKINNFLKKLTGKQTVPDHLMKMMSDLIDLKGKHKNIPIKDVENLYVQLTGKEVKSSKDLITLQNFIEIDTHPHINKTKSFLKSVLKGNQPTRNQLITTLKLVDSFLTGRATDPNEMMPLIQKILGKDKLIPADILIFANFLSDLKKKQKK